MSKLVQYVEWNLPNIMPNKMYCYGEANLEANLVMQEPLEKLYKYENQPDMREKVKEYMSELDTEIDRCTKFIEDKLSKIKDNGEKGNLFIFYWIYNFENSCKDINRSEEWFTRQIKWVNLVLKSGFYLEIWR